MIKSTVEKRIEEIQEMAREERNTQFKVEAHLSSIEVFQQVPILYIDAIIKWTIERYVVMSK